MSPVLTISEYFTYQLPYKEYLITIFKFCPFLRYQLISEHYDVNRMTSLPTTAKLQFTKLCAIFFWTTLYYIPTRRLKRTLNMREWYLGPDQRCSPWQCVQVCCSCSIVRAPRDSRARNVPLNYTWNNALDRHKTQHGSVSTTCPELLDDRQMAKSRTHNFLTVSVIPAITITASCQIENYYFT